MALTEGQGVGNCAVENSEGQYCFSNFVEGSDYGGMEECNFAATGISGPLLFTHFDTESSYDILTIEGTAYSGGTALTGSSVTAGDPLIWRSDAATQATGFRACIVPCSSALSVEPTPSAREERTLASSARKAVTARLARAVAHRRRRETTTLLHVLPWRRV